jgi:hypothetical protein
VARLVQNRGPLELIRSDASVNLRVSHAVFPWHGAVSSLFVPHGFSSFADSYHAIQSWYGGFFWYGERTNIIMSYAGAFAYELGIIGLVFLGYVFSLVFQFRKQRILELVLLFVLLNSALPVAFPFVPLLIAILYASNRRPSMRRPQFHGRSLEAPVTP